MLAINDLKSAILELPKEEYNELREWFSEKDWEEWDEQMTRDSESGKLDFLIEEARAEKADGTLKPL